MTVMSSNGTRMIQFGVFEVDLRAGELRRNGARVKLQEQPLQILDPACWNGRARWSHGKSCGLAYGRPTRLSISITVSTPPSAGFGTPWETAPRTRVLLRPSPGGVTAFWCRSVGCRPLSRLSFRFRHPSAPVPGGSSRQRSSCCVAGLGAGLFLGRRGSQTSPASPVVERRLTANPSEYPISSAALSYDGKYLAFSDDTGFYLRQVDTGETHPLALPEGFKAKPVSWFPDGSHILATSLAGPSQEPGLWQTLRPWGKPAQAGRAGPGSGGLARRHADRVSERDLTESGTVGDGSGWRASHENSPARPAISSVRRPGPRTASGSRFCEASIGQEPTAYSLRLKFSIWPPANDGWSRRRRGWGRRWPGLEIAWSMC